ncbi:hypothetical protein D3C71_1837540 [compost metagenome]
MIMSPGCNSMPSEHAATSVATSKIMSRVLALCSTSPFSRQVSCRPLAPAGSSSALTNSGPKPPLRSKFFPHSHWPERNW